MSKKQRYIVVDDDATNNMICEFTIKRIDKEADIRLFIKPEDALAYIKKEYGKTNRGLPAVLFLDLNMPTMTGWEFLDVFKEFDKSVKNQFTIYILSSSIEDFPEEAVKYPFIAGFLSKPLKTFYLENVIRNVENTG